MTNGPVNLSRWDKIIVDTCCLMEGAMGWDIFGAQLKCARTKVIIPTAVEREIGNLLSNKNAEKRAKAAAARHVVSKLIDDDIGEIAALNGGRGSQNNIADEEILSHVVLFRRKHNFLILTADRLLATRLLGGDVARTRRYLDVGLIKSDGGLEFWEGVQCDDCRMFTAARTNERAKEKVRCRDCIQKSVRASNMTATGSKMTTNLDRPKSFAATVGKVGIDPKVTKVGQISASIPSEMSSSKVITASKTSGPDGIMGTSGVRSSPAKFEKLTNSRKPGMASQGGLPRTRKLEIFALTAGALASALVGEIPIPIAIIEIIKEIRRL